MLEIFFNQTFTRFLFICQPLTMFKNYIQFLLALTILKPYMVNNQS